jgi:release factor glutamine methyltransferase
MIKELSLAIMHTTTIKEALEQGTHTLAHMATKSARRDAQVLLNHVLGVERSVLYAYPEQKLSVEQERNFSLLVERRAQGEPVAYLVGHKEFYGRDFIVDQRVLIPRPETELLVEAALNHIRHQVAAGQMPVVADVGTGSGAIAITLAEEERCLPYLYACDISSDALAVAYLNAQCHAVEQRIRLLQGDLLTPLPEAVDVLTANLPYVGTDEISMLALDVYHYEPHLALFSGPQGLDIVRRFCQEAKQSGKLKTGAVILLELGYQQQEPLSQQVQELWPQSTITTIKDYAGWDRVMQVVI